MNATNRFERLTQCTTEQAVKDLAGQCVQQMGLQGWIFSISLPLHRDGGPVHWAMGNLPDEWHAMGPGLWLEIAGSAPSRWQSGIPQAWTAEPPPAAAPSAPDSGRLRPTQRLAAALGATGGICTPVAGAGDAAGFLTLLATTPVAARALQERRSAALLFSRYLHLACQPFIDELRQALAPRLSAREIECLSWAAMGKTAWEIGQLLAISEHTAVFHMRKAHAKLGVANRHQAIARSIQIGLLAANGSVAGPPRVLGAADPACPAPAPARSTPGRGRCAR